MNYRKYRVKSGDCIASIAFNYGFFPDTIWFCDKNSELRKLREDPDVLLEGDTVFIPEKRLELMNIADGAKHTFKRKGVPKRLTIQFERNGSALKKLEYVITIDGLSHEGVLDNDGVLSEGITPNAKKAIVKFNDSAKEYEFELGFLEPIDQENGIWIRLENLGYGDQLITNIALRKQAVCDFQRDHELEITGLLDTLLIEKLGTIYGS